MNNSYFNRFFILYIFFSVNYKLVYASNNQDTNNLSNLSNLTLSEQNNFQDIQDIQDNTGNLTADFDLVDTLFEEDYHNLPKPKFDKPSGFTVLFRHYGISLMFTYFKFKEKLTNKFSLLTRKFYKLCQD